MDEVMRFPFTTFPQGTFAVAFSHELKRGSVKPLIFMGEKLVLFRTTHGEVVAIDRYCPHLGADLANGIVKSESLICPFHGIPFSKEGSVLFKNKGNCDQRFKNWPVFEKYGLIFLSHSRSNDKIIEFPDWDMSGWSKPYEHCLKVKSHPQELMENAVDKRHFVVLHKFSNIQNVTPLKLYGHELEIGYIFKRRKGMFGFLDKNGGVTLRVDVHHYGLGFTDAHVYMPEYDLHSRHMLFPTPIDGEFIHIRALTSLKILDKLSVLPRALRELCANFVCRLGAKGFLADLEPDIKNWECKRYLPTPIYLPDDEDIGRFREWAVQFY